MSIRLGTAVATAICLCSCSHEHTRTGSATRLTGDSAAPIQADVRSAARYCQVELPDSWRTAFARGVQRHGVGEQRQIVLVAPDGSLFGETFVPSRRHVVYWSPQGGRTGAVVQKFDIEDGSAQLLGAAFDGRYIAYTLLRSMATFDSWILYVWDTHLRGAPREIARTPRQWNQMLPGPLNIPVVHAGQVFWVQATGGPEGETAIYAYDVAHDLRRMIQQGHPLAPIVIGDKLVWSESPGPGALTELRAVNIDSRQPVALPGQLAALRGATFIAADGHAVAWADRSLHELWIWRTERLEPERVLTSPEGYPLQLLQIAGNAVTWDDGNQQWILDLRSNGYAPLTPTAGARSSGGTRLRVLFAPRRLGNGLIELGDETVIDTAELAPIPGC